jgi:hypothetical protein
MEGFCMKIQNIIGLMVLCVVSMKLSGDALDNYLMGNTNYTTVVSSIVRDKIYGRDFSDMFEEVAMKNKNSSCSEEVMRMLQEELPVSVQSKRRPVAEAKNMIKSSISKAYNCLKGNTAVQQQGSSPVVLFLQGRATNLSNAVRAIGSGLYGQAFGQKFLAVMNAGNKCSEGFMDFLNELPGSTQGLRPRRTVAAAEELIKSETERRYKCLQGQGG